MADELGVDSMDVGESFWLSILVIGKYMKGYEKMQPPYYCKFQSIKDIRIPNT